MIRTLPAARVSMLLTITLAGTEPWEEGWALAACCAGTVHKWVT